MICAKLALIETELRRAASRRAYADVERLVVSAGAAALEEVRTLPPGDGRMREIASWLDRLYQWTEVMLRTARAAQADELRRIPFVKTYLHQQTLSKL